MNTTGILILGDLGISQILPESRFWQYSYPTEYPYEINIARRNINNLRYTDDTTLMAEIEEELEPLDESERGERKSWLKVNIQKTKIMASSPITSWEIDGETVETVSDFIFLGSKITAEVIAAMKLKDAYSLEGQL